MHGLKSLSYVRGGVTMDKENGVQWNKLELEAEEMTDVHSYASVSGISSIGCAATAMTSTSTVSSIGTASTYWPG